MSVCWKAPNHSLGENKDWEAFDNTLQIGHAFGPNGVQREFYNNSSKMSLWGWAANH